MKIRLEVAHKGANIKKVELRSETLIGRGGECNLRILSKEVSRKHCRITMNDSAVCVRDLESANGTFVDGKRIPSDRDVPLGPDSHLLIGRIDFVVRFDDVQAAVTVDRDESTSDLADFVSHAADSTSSSSPESGPACASLHDDTLPDQELQFSESESVDEILVDQHDVDEYEPPDTAQFSLEESPSETLDSDELGSDDEDESGELDSDDEPGEEMELETDEEDVEEDVEEELEDEEWEADPENEYEWEEEWDEEEDDSEQLSDESSEDEDESLDDE